MTVLPASSPVPSSPSDALTSARAVLMAESAALRTLADGLDSAFAQVTDLLVATKGRVVVSGMGKSGHIGRKIAATLASTGTPALFVHPGEASHGDLGMIVRDDVVIALSNSGETAELDNLIAYTRRFGITLIAVTSRAQSTLAESADLTLLLPPVPEVCPMGLAPTTSTTMTLALGDALAIAVLERKGFTAEDFRNFHPGGKLGNRLKRVSDLMHGKEDLPLAKPDQTMAEVLVTMTAKRFGCVGIVDDNGTLSGIITDGDLRRHMGIDLLQRRARDIMTTAPMTIGPRTLAAEALNLLNDKNRTQLFIVDDTAIPVGILHIHDLLRAGVA